MSLGTSPVLLPILFAGKTDEIQAIHNRRDGIDPYTHKSILY